VRPRRPAAGAGSGRSPHRRPLPPRGRLRGLSCAARACAWASPPPRPVQAGSTASTGSTGAAGSTVAPPVRRRRLGLGGGFGAGDCLRRGLLVGLVLPPARAGAAAGPAGLRGVLRLPRPTCGSGSVGSTSGLLGGVTSASASGIRFVIDASAIGDLALRPAPDPRRFHRPAGACGGGGACAPARRRCPRRSRSRSRSRPPSPRPPRPPRVAVLNFSIEKSGEIRNGSASTRTAMPYRASIWAMCSRLWFIRKLAMATGAFTSTSRDRLRVPSSSIWRRIAAPGCRRTGRARCRGNAGRLRGRLEHARPQPLARHLQQAEARDAAHLDARAVGLELVLEALLDRGVVLALVHVDEVDHDQAGEVAQAQLARDLVAPPRGWS
jgi:hypothetical protein